MSNSRSPSPNSRRGPAAGGAAGAGFRGVGGTRHGRLGGGRTSRGQRHLEAVSLESSGEVTRAGRISSPSGAQKLAGVHGSRTHLRPRNGRTTVLKTAPLTGEDALPRIPAVPAAFPR